MHTLVVHAHPNPESYNAALFRLACDTLRAGGHTVEALDLYAEGFNPVLSREERLDYMADPQAAIAKLQPEVERLQRCEHLVMVHPTWWYGPPAMMKGWLERVWLPDVVFSQPRSRGERIQPLLTKVRCFTVITHGGAPWWWLVLMGNPHRRLLMRGMRWLLARDCRTRWLQLHSINSSTAEERTAFMAGVQRYLASLPATR